MKNLFNSMQDLKDDENAIWEGHRVIRYVFGIGHNKAGILALSLMVYGKILLDTTKPNYPEL